MSDDLSQLLNRARAAQHRMDAGPAGPVEIGFDDRVMARIASGAAPSASKASKSDSAWTGVWLWRLLSGFATVSGAIACLTILGEGDKAATDDLVAFCSAGDRAWLLRMID